MFNRVSKKANLSDRLVNALLLSLVCLLITGCWDQRELQERAFVLAAAIDVNKEPDDTKGLRRIESFTHAFGGYPYRLSLQVLKPGPGGSDSEQQQSGGKTYTLSNTGISMFEMVRDMRGQTSKALWFEHIQIVIISEEAVKEAGLSKLLDFFLRDGEMRWRTRVYITPGNARKLMDFKPPTGEPGGVYLAAMARQGKKNPHIAEARTDLGFTNATINQNGDVAMPRIELAEDKVKINGLALFKKDRFVGYVDEYTVKGLKFIRGTERSALIPFERPVHPGDFVVFELFRHNTKLTPHVAGDSIWFTLDIAMRGNLGEVACARAHDTRDPVYIEKARAAFAREAERNIAHAQIVCQSMGVDALGFARYLKAYKPEAWEKIKDNWEEVFPTIPLYTSVNVTILHVGEHR